MEALLEDDLHNIIDHEPDFYLNDIRYWFEQPTKGNLPADWFRPKLKKRSL